MAGGFRIAGVDALETSTQEPMTSIFPTTSQSNFGTQWLQIYTLTASDTTVLEARPEIWLEMIDHLCGTLRPFASSLSEHPSIARLL
jgi:hypothetical protein